MAEKAETKASEKKSTSSTKNTVQKRKSSVTSKGTTKKGSSSTKKTTTSKTAKSPKTTEKVTTTSKVSNKASTNKPKTTATKKASTTKKSTSTTKKVAKQDDVEKVVKEEPKKVRNSKKTTSKKENNKIADETTNKKETTLATEIAEEAVVNKDIEELKSNNAETKQIQKKEAEEIERVVVKELKSRKKLPSKELGKINTRVFHNIFIAILIMLYLNFVVLGFMNIEKNVFITDLKVFSIALLFVSLGIFEYGYRKDSGKHILYGAEILLLAFATMTFIYINLMSADRFIYIVALVTYLFAIYYVAKSIVIYSKMKKEYFVNTMKEMIKK